MEYIENKESRSDDLDEGDNDVLRGQAGGVENIQR